MKCVFVLYLIRLRRDNSIGKSSFRTVGFFLVWNIYCVRMQMCACAACSRCCVWIVNMKQEKKSHTMSLTLKWHPCLSRTMSARTLAHCIHTHTSWIRGERERKIYRRTNARLTYTHRHTYEANTSKCSNSRNGNRQQQQNPHAVHTQFLCALLLVSCPFSVSFIRMNRRY